MALSLHPSASQLERQTDLLLMLDRLHQTLTDLTDATRGLRVNEHLATLLALIPASGVFTADWSVPFAAISIDNLGTHQMTVAGAGPQLGAPGAGVGIHQIPAGGSAVINLAGRELSIYGTPGDMANLQVHGLPQPPAYGPGAQTIETVTGVGAAAATGATALATVEAGTVVEASQTSAIAAAIVATLPGAAGKTTYLKGFEVTGGGATAAGLALVTVTGLATTPLNYAFAVPAGAAVGAAPLVVEFGQALPASAVAGAVSVNVPTLGAGNVLACVAAHGFQL